MVGKDSSGSIYASNGNTVYKKDKNGRCSSRQLTIKVDRPKLSPEDIKKPEEGMQQTANAK